MHWDKLNSINITAFFMVHKGFVSSGTSMPTHTSKLESGVWIDIATCCVHLVFCEKPQ